jgi:hypothetical protein
MKVTTENDLRETVRDQLKILIKQAQILLEEKPAEKLSNAEFAKGLKTNAANLAADVPTKYNQDFVKAMQALKVMAQHDRAKFEKIVKLALQYDDAAAKKAQK